MINQLPFVVNDYKFLKVLGKGGYSTVYLVESTTAKGILYVAKVTPIASEPIKEGDVDACEAEIKALMTLSHQNIIRFYDHFNYGQDFIMILEYCPNGSLQSETMEAGLPYNQFISYARQILSALAFCHSKNIAHRDIKLGNILIDATGHIKLSDFGISITDANKLTNSFSGSLLYEPPEIINKIPHNPMQADIWSLGVLFAYMINGCNPWRCDNIGVLKTRICSATYRLRSSTPKNVKNMIAKMLVVEPEKRITAAELLKDPIFEVSSEISPISSDFSFADALSPRGRAQAVTLRNTYSFEVYKKKPINIFRMDLLDGPSHLPKLKARYPPRVLSNTH